MKESHGEGVATHTGPESCVGTREGADEALTGEDASRVLSREIGALVRKHWVVPDAPAVGIREEPYLMRRYRETHWDPAWSETPREQGHTLYGNRESSRLPARSVSAGRIGKSKDARR
jgi:RNA-directed DNA polymerase